MKQHLKKYLLAILASNGNLAEIIAGYRREVTDPASRRMMVETLIEELGKLAERGVSDEASPEILAEFARKNRALLRSLGEIGAAGVREGLENYCRDIKNTAGCGDLWVLACGIIGKCQRREFSADAPY